MSTLELLQKNLLLLVCPPRCDFVVEPALIVLKVPEELKLLHHVKVTAHGEDCNTVTSGPLKMQRVG